MAEQDASLGMHLEYRGVLNVKGKGEMEVSCGCICWTTVIRGSRPCLIPPFPIPLLSVFLLAPNPRPHVTHNL